MKMARGEHKNTTISQTKHLPMCRSLQRGFSIAYWIIVPLQLYIQHLRSTMDPYNPHDVWRLSNEKLRALHQNPRDPDVRQALVSALELLAHLMQSGAYPPQLD